LQSHLRLLVTWPGISSMYNLYFIFIFLEDENEASSHDLALMLGREDSFNERGIKETLELAHAGHTESFSFLE
jgi:hypothetical protein